MITFRFFTFVVDNEGSAPKFRLFTYIYIEDSVVYGSEILYLNRLYLKVSLRFHLTSTSETKF